MHPRRVDPRPRSDCFLARHCPIRSSGSVPVPGERPEQAGERPDVRPRFPLRCVCHYSGEHWRRDELAERRAGQFREFMTHAIREAPPWTIRFASTSTCSARTRCRPSGTTSFRICPHRRPRRCTRAAWIRSAQMTSLRCSRWNSSCKRCRATDTSRSPVGSSTCIASGVHLPCSAPTDSSRRSVRRRASITSTREFRPPARTSRTRQSLRRTTTRRRARES